MIQKKVRKALFLLLRHCPKPMRDAFFRSRLNIPPLSEDIHFELAKSQSDLDQAFQLLHDAYVREGYSKPHISKRRVTDYHALPSTSTLVAKCKSQVIGTISVIRDGAFGLPADAVVELARFRDQGERLGEVSSLAIAPPYRGRSGEVMFHLFKYMLHYSIDCFGLDRFVIVVHPDRIPLYESILTFELLHRAIVRSYRFANGAPGVCATLDLKTLAQTFARVYKNSPPHRDIHRFFFGGFTPLEQQQMHFPARPFHTIMDPVMSPANIDYFFNQCTASLCRLDERRVKILQSIYTAESYEPVWPKQDAANWQNQRAHCRFDVDCTATLEPWSHAPLRILDASRTGLRLHSAAPLPDVAPASLNISVGSNQNVSLETNVKWQSNGFYGLRIVQADPCWHQFIDFLENQIA